MSDLSDFLLARITEDETAAMMGRPIQWALTSPPADDVSLAAVGGTGLSYNHGAARHIARWDPARVLAECEAKRRIITKISEIEYNSGDPWTHEMGEEIFAALTLPYADHPDYRKEWRA